MWSQRPGGLLLRSPPSLWWSGKLLEFLSYVNVDIICLYFSFWDELIYTIPFLSGFFFHLKKTFFHPIDSFVFYFIQKVRDCL